MDIHVYLHNHDEERLALIVRELGAIIKGQERIMALLDDLKAGEAALFGAVDALIAQSTTQNEQIAALQAQIAAGTPATAADLQAIIDADAAELAKIKAALPAPTPPAP